MKKILFFTLIIISPFIGWAANFSLSEEFRGAIAPPLFAEGRETLISGEKIVEQLRPILRDRLSKMNYDRIFPIVQFLDHYEKSKEEFPSISPLEAFKSFRFQPTISGGSGGPCVSLTFDLFENLPDGIGCYIVAARLPRKFHQFMFPELCHTAIMIHYRSPDDPSDKGYVLIDPSFDICEPILLVEEGDPFVYDMKEKGIWTFSISQDLVLCDIMSDEREEMPGVSPEDWQMIYRTDELLNPIESSAMPMILVDRRPSLLSRREDGTHLAHLNAELNKKRVIWNEGGFRYEPVLFISFMQDLSFP